MKNTKKSSAKNHVKDIKIFLKKRKTKGEKRPEKDIKILLKKKNQKSIRIIVNLMRIFGEQKQKKVDYKKN